MNTRMNGHVDDAAFNGPENGGPVDMRDIRSIRKTVEATATDVDVIKSEMRGLRVDVAARAELEARRHEQVTAVLETVVNGMLANSASLQKLQAREDRVPIHASPWFGAVVAVAMLVASAAVAWGCK